MQAFLGNGSMKFKFLVLAATLATHLAGCGGGGGEPAPTALVLAQATPTVVVNALPAPAAASTPSSATPTASVTTPVTPPTTSSTAAADAAPTTPAATPTVVAPVVAAATPVVTAPVTPVVTAPTLSPVLVSTPMSKYEGTWKSCADNILAEFSLSATDALGRGQLVARDSFYSLDDRTCAGAPYATLIYPTYTFIIDGTKTLATGQLVDKLVLSTPAEMVQIQGVARYVTSYGSTTAIPLSSVNASTKIYIVDPKFSNNTTNSDGFVAAGDEKGFLVLINRQLALSDSQSLKDAQGYPTALATRRFVLTK